MSSAVPRRLTVRNPRAACRDGGVDGLFVLVPRLGRLPHVSRSSRSAFSPATLALSAGDSGRPSSSARPEAFAPNG